MKYWKGINSKKGQFGTMSEIDIVPDSIECDKNEYDGFIQSTIPIIKPKLIKLKDSEGNIIEYEIIN